MDTRELLMHDLIPVCADHSYKAIKHLLLEKALRCPECGAPSDFLMAMSDRSIVTPCYLIACSECHYEGPFARNIPDAVKRWNKSTGLMVYLKKKWAKK
jgi:hypothetical protein